MTKKGNAYIGVDLHKKFFLCYFLHEKEEKSFHKRYEFDSDGLKKFKKELIKLKGEGLNLFLSVEVLTGSDYFYEETINFVDELVLVNSNKFKVIATSTSKTDKIDSKILAIYHEKGLLPSVYYPGNEVISLRMLVSNRHSLVKDRRKHMNQIHSLLLRFGLKVPKRSLGTKKQMSKLKTLNFSNQALTHLLELLITQLTSVMQSIKLIEKELFNIISNSKNLELKQSIEILETIPGIGFLSASIIMSSIGDIKRFSSNKKLAAYFGLVPSVRNSGGKIFHGSITKQGNKIARTILVQNAYCLLRSKKAGALRDFYNQIKSRSGNGKAVVALARKMVKIIFTLLSKKEEFDILKYSSPTKKSLINKKVDFVTEENISSRAYPSDFSDKLEESLIFSGNNFDDYEACSLELDIIKEKKATMKKVRKKAKF